MNPDPRLGEWRQAIETALGQSLPPEGAPRLLEAMRYALLGGGKRLRPLLVLATGTALGESPARLMPAALAVECIHVFSLIHDDLPAMDDDALRHGRATLHVAYDQATAIIAGDALQALAFDILARADLPAERVAPALALLARATGVAGMCGGQQLDMDADAGDLAALERLHALKTGALIRAAVGMGAILAGADPATRGRLDGFAADLGLAFQVRDDLLDLEGDAGTLGKTPGKDAAQGKITFPGLLGADASRRRLEQLLSRMRAQLEGLGESGRALEALARFAVERRH
jgi:farnesyl diphosphate synthase